VVIVRRHLETYFTDIWAHTILRGKQVGTYCTKGPSIKYVTLFWPILTSSLCHTLSHIPGPPPKRYVSHLGPFPTIFSRPSTKTRTKPPVQILSQLFAGGLSGGLLSGRFCPGWLLSVPPSVRTRLCQQKVKHHYKISCFICMIKMFISVTSHALDSLPLSPTVTPSRTPPPRA